MLKVKNQYKWGGWRHMEEEKIDGARAQKRQNI